MKIISDIKQLFKICTQIRRDILRMTHGAESGHPGGSLGCTEFMVALYFNILNHNPEFKMDGIGEDIFFLSNGVVFIKCVTSACMISQDLLERAGCGVPQCRLFR